MTLWELAQGLRAMGKAWGSSDRANCYYICADRVEQWAREKAKEWKEVTSYKFSVSVARDICMDFTEEICHMLGVPGGE